MFTIELVVVQGRDGPGVVDRMACPTDRIADAESTARAILPHARKRLPETPPDGYQIDNEGIVVLRSWA
jgi:hypothetical protein